MNYRIRADRPTMVVGCSLGFVVLLVLYWVVHFWLLRQDFAGEIAAIQPRTARILGIQESFDQLNMAANEADSLLQELVYPADRTSAMTAIQDSPNGPATVARGRASENTFVDPLQQCAV